MIIKIEKVVKLEKKDIDFAINYNEELDRYEYEEAGATKWGDLAVEWIIAKFDFDIMEVETADDEDKMEEYMKRFKNRFEIEFHRYYGNKELVGVQI